MGELEIYRETANQTTFTRAPAAGAGRYLVYGVYLHQGGGATTMEIQYSDGTNHVRIAYNAAATDIYIDLPGIPIDSGHYIRGVQGGANAGNHMSVFVSQEPIE